jgi:SAM-dependent methyltransferase
MTEMLDLDGEVLSGMFDDVTTWIAQHLGTHPAERVLGSAQITALDASPDMLEHLSARAEQLGVASRVQPHQADLDSSPLPTGPFDLAWASASMHHMADPAKVLAELRTALAPGGLFAMLEFETFPRFLPDGFGDGVEERLNRDADAQREAHHPTVNSDWTARLTSSGFTVLQERTFDTHLSAPLSPTAQRYARITLSRLRSSSAASLSAEDHATLDSLLSETGPDRLETRDDLSVRSSRRAWIATPA